MTDEEIAAMPWTRDLMTPDERKTWVATRKEAGRAIDIATCELGHWAAYDADPYGVRKLAPEMQQIGTNRFVRSPESRGWVCEDDLPPDTAGAMYDRIKVEWGLFRAAAEKHPGWKVGSFGPEKIDDSVPGHRELIAWFRESFPQEAHAIEATIRAKIREKKGD